MVRTRLWFLSPIIWVWGDDGVCCRVFFELIKHAKMASSG